jgi:6-phosphogluconate dehydrogenase
MIEGVKLPFANPEKMLGIVGLGKMGGNIARRLSERGWAVRGFDPHASAISSLAKEGVHGSASVAELVRALPRPRVLWLMVPHDSVERLLFGKGGLAALLAKGDIIIDGGNSYYKDSVRRAKKLAGRGIAFLDVGFSGGPSGARSGGCLMVGGRQDVFKRVELLFAELAQRDGYEFFPGAGAGHFVKMIHNGIEYGMMQSLAEGFALLKRSRFSLDLSRIAEVYNRGSVIESRLTGWLAKAFKLHGEELADVSGTVGHTGEGAWTVKTAREMRIKTKIIEEALAFRVRSAKNPDYTGKILSALREQFGGHDIKK